MSKLAMKTPDLTDLNIQKLAEIFPSCVTETLDAAGNPKMAIDFDLLKQELSHSIVEGNVERYQLDWPGKRQSLLTANAPIAKTLRPAREESVDFDKTENLFIEGDNLEALKLLQESYLGKVKMIYIDPPYNTGNDFVYNDDFAEDADEYFERSLQKDEEGNRLVANPESKGRYHSDWLSMMHSRLRLARNLLTDDGVIMVHIDENEYVNLEKLLSEVFGENNNLGTIVWDKRNPKGAVAGVSQQHELIAIYSFNFNVFKEKVRFELPKENALKILNKATTLYSRRNLANRDYIKEFKSWLGRQSDFSGGEKAYNQIDEFGDVFQSVSMAAPDKPETRSHRALIHPVTKKACPTPEKGWRYPDKTMDGLLQSNQIVFGADETTQPRRKYHLKDYLNEKVTSIMSYGGSDDLKKEFSIIFDNPKPVYIAKKLIQSICCNNDLILDFFAGSSTTAHAVMQLNAEDGGNRKFIMVQLPEVTDEKSEAFKAGYKTIAEISKERIRRAGKQILESDEIHEDWNRDIGFRVLKVAESNMKDVYYNPQELSQSDLVEQIDNVKVGVTPEDLLFQVMLDWGLELSLPVTTEIIEDKTVYFVAGNALIACFDDGITESLVKTLAERLPLRLLFRDNYYKDNDTKINAKEILKQFKVLEDKEIELKSI